MQGGKENLHIEQSKTQGTYKSPLGIWANIFTT